MEQEVILKVENLKKYFPIKGGFFSKTIGNVKAVDGVVFRGKKRRNSRNSWRIRLW